MGLWGQKQQKRRERQRRGRDKTEREKEREYSRSLNLTLYWQRTDRRFSGEHRAGRGEVEGLYRSVIQLLGRVDKSNLSALK